MESDSAIALCLNNGDVEKTLGVLNLTAPIRTRFILNCNACFEGKYQYDGIFNNSARYRHCVEDSMWILFSNGFWCFSASRDAKKGILINLTDKIGRRVNTIQEIPTIGWDLIVDEYTPYSFKWINI